VLPFWQFYQIYLEKYCISILGEFSIKCRQENQPKNLWVNKKLLRWVSSNSSETTQ